MLKINKLSTEAKMVLDGLPGTVRGEIKRASFNKSLRRALINELRQKEKVKIDTLAELFRVNRTTVMRDLKTKNSQNLNIIRQQLNSLSKVFDSFARAFILQLDQIKRNCGE